MPDERTAPGVSARTAHHHGDLRAHLIATVRELMETHGPDGFSMAEAARRAGVSSAAPCKHFKDRHDAQFDGRRGDDFDYLMRISQSVPGRVSPT